MYSELKGSVPKLPTPLAKTLIQRAWADVRRQNLWSFQIYDSNWISPQMINTGTATATQGSNIIVLSAAAAAAVTASIAAVGAFNPINQRQFRIGISTVYNIISFSTPNLTIDRGFMEPSTSGAAYQIYQVYYPAPFSDHLTWVSIRDMVNFTDLVTTKSRIWLDEQDPQRTWYYFPTHSVFYRNGTDATNALTFKYPIYELWGVPLTNRSYQLYGIRKGVDLTGNTDTLPGAVTEECVIERAKKYVYEWAEANKGSLPRNQGPDFKYLMGESDAAYKRLFKDLRRQDRETVDSWFSIRRSSLYGKYYAQYNTVNGTAYPGAYLG
jgi:hypothetical protein